MNRNTECIERWAIIVQIFKYFLMLMIKFRVLFWHLYLPTLSFFLLWHGSTRNVPKQLFALYVQLTQLCIFIMPTHQYNRYFKNVLHFNRHCLWPGPVKATYKNSVSFLSFYDNIIIKGKSILITNPSDMILRYGTDTACFRKAIKWEVSFS